MDPVAITEPAAVAALKHIYDNNGPSALDWDISATGQVIIKGKRAEAREGELISLDVSCVSLHGVFRLRNVETLSVLKADYCNLDGIDFNNLPSLKKLSLRHNCIVDLSSLADLKSLTELDVRGNEVIDLRPLAGLTNLTKLDLGDNMIRDFSSLGQLKALVSEGSLTNQRKQTKAAIWASAEKKARERKIGKCPNCRRVIRYPDIENWDAYPWFHLWVYCSAPIYRKSGNCPDCGQSITVQGMGSCLYGMPFSRYPWEIVIEGRPTTFDLLFNGPPGWLGDVKTLFRLLLRR